MVQELSPNKQALLKIRELKQQIEFLESQQRIAAEPIAIVSMACRFPKRSSSPELFWDSLVNQTDEVSEIPPDRWDLAAFHDDDTERPGRMYARHGVFLDRIDQMDPEFFGISPREATWVDPQQRLLMEVGWEALERAGWIPERIADETGVFIGWMHNDYQNEASDSFLNLNPYIATGAAGSFLSGRLAYYLGLQGPSVAVDTACSSSLVALHLACMSLQQHECNRALVGGVNAICSPTTNILTCKLKALSPSGHSRAFDAAADGYLRGEGCGVVALRRLTDAESDGDSILGVIRGSAIGHNGFSSGLTAPNPQAQERVIRQALQRARLTPNDVAYLEAHGTGTELGDPIEIRAAAAALTGDRTADNPLLVGSVKTNIGHLEAAAGMAGLVKVLLAIQHRQIPGQLNFENPNPHIPWDQIPVRVLTEMTDWPDADRCVAGVSAFGMSGTNAHAVISGHATKRRRDQVSVPSMQDEDQPELIVLSGKNEDAVHELAERLSDHLTGDPSAGLRDVAYTSSTARSHFENRAAIVAKNREDAIASLRSLTHSGESAHAIRGQARRRPKVAWQFTGQGAQFVGMARELYDKESVFQQAIDQCTAWLSESRTESLTQILFENDEKIHHTSWTQPAIFAVQMGLVKLLNHYGLAPDFVMGHSVGQYAAACVAGIMTWEQGLQLISERGRLIGELPSGGTMLAIFAHVDQVRETIKEFPDVSLAALNGTHIVISGPGSSVQKAEEHFAAREIRCRKLNTSHAFHSELMEPALAPFQKVADQISFQAPQIPLICNMSGEILPTEPVDGGYWARHIREEVHFSPSVQTLQESGCDILLELGPQSVLTRMAAADWKSSQAGLISCLSKDQSDRESLLTAIGKMYCQGVSPEFTAMYAGRDCQRVLLPTYPFQRRRFWGPDKPRAEHADDHTAHPLLGGKMTLAGSPNESRFEKHVEKDSPAWLPDHEVMGQVVMPGAAYLEMASTAAGFSSIINAVFRTPLQVTGRTAMQTVVRDAGDNKVIETYSALSGETNWELNFSAQVGSANDESPPPANLDDLLASLPESVTPDAFYQKMHEIGLNYGPQFQTITKLHHSQHEVLSEIRTSGDIRGYRIPPPILDGALHSLAVGLLREDDGNLFLPVSVDRFQCYGDVEGEVWCHAKWIQPDGPNRKANLTLFDPDGKVLAVIEGLNVQQINRAALRQMSGAGAKHLLYDIEWEPIRLTGSQVKGKEWLIVDGGQREDLAAKLSKQLEEHDNRATVICSQSTDEEWDRAFGKVSDNDAPYQPAGIVWLCGETDPTEDTSGLPAATQKNCSGIISLIQSLQKRNFRSIECGLAFVTTAAQSLSEEECDASQSQYWGLGRVLGAELPAYRVRLIDTAVKDSSNEDTLRSHAEVLIAETRDNQLALREDQIFVPRLQNTKRHSKRERVRIRPDASYLITGGLGMLGRLAAKWLADQGAKQVVLVSRREPDDATRKFLSDIEAAGCNVVIHAADMSCRESVAELFHRFGHDLLPLAGVIHAAGVLDDGLIGEQSWERFEKVLTPKISAARLLDEFTKDLALDFFVLYSSAASVLGSPGQSNYATGNAFLDGLAHQRRAAGLPAVSVNWGPWAAGMADDERILKRLRLQGISPLDIDEAHEALAEILSSGLVQATVLDVDWRRMQSGLGGESPAMLERLAGSRQKSQLADSAFVGQLKKLKGNAQRELVLTTVQKLFQDVLSTTDAPETDRPLIEMGLDSLMAVEFSTELQMLLGEQYTIGPTMLFDHPTIEAISDHVLDMVSAMEVDEAPSSPTQTPARPDGSSRRDKEPIAIVGMSCRFPGARDIEEFWNNILNGIDSVREIPNDRWDIDRFYDPEGSPGTMPTREGGFIDDIADFDPEFFNISEQEAAWIDPQHRMLLENSYRALEDAGIPTAPLADANVGVFMGIMGQDYAFLPKLEDRHIIEAFQGAGLSHSAGVGRISYVFGFEGPSIAVDTASSSSLVALFQAMRSLQDGNCNMALAGGVNAILAPVNSLLMSRAGLLAPDGRCKSFSAEANGFGRGEGCGVVVLKRLSDAERDGDRVLAVLRGGAVVHNGFSGGITSPSGKAQSRVITEALKDAEIAPSQVQYLEAHGTGTEFGDPMELGAAAAVYGKGRPRENPLLVGSVKANISHLEAAGGISGLIKTVLAIHRGVIPPQAHFEHPSPHIPWKRMPLQVVKETTPWPEAEERLAGVTALGLVGTNAHVILSSEPNRNDVDTPENDQVMNRSIHLLPLSARTPVALEQLLSEYREFIKNHPEVSIADLCYTASVGRRHYEHRLALTVSDLEDALAKLNKSLEDAGRSENKIQTHPKLTWIFPDEGDVLSASRQLYNTESVFRDWVSVCDQLSQEFDSGVPLLADQLSQDNESSDGLSSLLLFAFQSGLAKLLQAWETEPECVFGWGVGQYTAACIAGVMSFEDAYRLLVKREKSLAAIASGGATEDVLNQFEGYADSINFYPPNIRLIDSLTGDIVPIHRSLGGSYWREHCEVEHEPVGLSEALGNDHNILFGQSDSWYTGEKLSPLLQDNCDVTSSILHTVGRLYEAGVLPEFQVMYQDQHVQRVRLPHYPFQKKRYWITEIPRTSNHSQEPEFSSEK